MAKKKKGPSPPRNDAELVERLRNVAPEVLTANAEPGWFETVADRLLDESAGEERPHFYCRPCGAYHLKTHPHHTEMKKRKRKNAK